MTAADDDQFECVCPEDAYERLRLLTGRTLREVQQDIRDGKYQRIRVPGGSRIAIPANAPPTLRDQLDAERQLTADLTRERDDYRRRLNSSEKENLELLASRESLRASRDGARAQLSDEVHFRAYLTVITRMLGEMLDWRDGTLSTPPWDSAALIPPASMSCDGAPGIILLDGREITPDPKLVSALRSYVAEYRRVYGTARFLRVHVVPPAVLGRWDAGHVGYTIPLRVLTRLGTDVEKVAAAERSLRTAERRVDPDVEDRFSHDHDDDWCDDPGAENARIVSVRPRVSDERAEYGEEVAQLVHRWRDLRARVLDPPETWRGERTREEELVYRESLLEVELNLMRTHRMSIMGGGSGHQLDGTLWDDEGRQAEIEWRAQVLEDVRRLLERERWPWYRRLMDRLVPWS